ncbi:FecR domain-containing protein [Sphaerotilus sp.]|uniref:FecR domain-containing protein n=1 Tax=Sphaerotilus sp. TaxID=2093942 RepID=UPI002ACD2AB2|nr:FecR domain-containing protein [Sphaerotilus sp.]MDZ7857985.1 FecR domain-containing protein [Sphaerotilus sp.]
MISPLRLVAALLAMLLSAASASTPAGAPGASGAQEEFLYTVQPGDSAWTITARYLRDARHWNGLRENNQLRGDRLRPGQVLRIPLPWLRLTTPQARLVTLQGDVTLNSGAGWEPARAGTLLPPGAWLRTAPAGSAMLGLADGTLVLVRPGSELRLVPLDAAQLAAWVKAQAATPATPSDRPTSRPADDVAPVRIELLRGGLESQVRPQSGNGRFEVRTPSAVTTVRGTEFRISAEGDSSRAEVVHGAVAFGNGHGQVALETATGSHATAGAEPAPAIPLLPGPDLQAIADRMSPAQLQALVLPALTGAVAYRIQWLADTAPDQLLLDRLQQAPLQPGHPGLPDGRYRLRVRGIDALGLEGLSGERTLDIATPPAPPPPPPPAPAPPRAPTLGLDRSAQRLVLHWTPVEPLGPDDWYQVQMALDPGFTAVVLDEPSPLQHLHLPLPRPGQPGPLHIRVRVRQPGGGHSAWSEPRVFDLRAPLESTP